MDVFISFLKIYYFLINIQNDVSKLALNNGVCGEGCDFRGGTILPAK